ncbi:hypothetical protein RGI81_003614 [Morganella morganii]|nr:hypothetical protein [Morganella morganii]
MTVKELIKALNDAAEDNPKFLNKEVRSNSEEGDGSMGRVDTFAERERFIYLIANSIN